MSEVSSSSIPACSALPRSLLDRRVLTDPLPNPVELLDPRWKEQKAKADARSASTNLRAVDAANNVKRLASQRGDVFDPNLGPADGGSLPDAKRARNDLGPQQPQRPLMMPAPPATLPPGAVGGLPQQQPINVEEQIKAIHQRFAAAAGQHGHPGGDEGRAPGT